MKKVLIFLICLFSMQAISLYADNWSCESDKSFKDCCIQNHGSYNYSSGECRFNGKMLTPN